MPSCRDDYVVRVSCWIFFAEAAPHNTSTTPRTHGCRGRAVVDSLSCVRVVPFGYQKTELVVFLRTVFVCSVLGRQFCLPGHRRPVGVPCRLSCRLVTRRLRLRGTSNSWSFTKTRKGLFVSPKIRPAAHIDCKRPFGDHVHTLLLRPAGRRSRPRAVVPLSCVPSSCCRAWVPCRAVNSASCYRRAIVVGAAVVPTDHRAVVPSSCRVVTSCRHGCR